MCRTIHGKNVQFTSYLGVSMERELREIQCVCGRGNMGGSLILELVKCIQECQVNSYISSSDNILVLGQSITFLNKIVIKRETETAREGGGEEESLQMH